MLVGGLSVVLQLTFFLQIFFQLCFRLKDFIKVVRLLWATRSINALINTFIPAAAVKHSTLLYFGDIILTQATFITIEKYQSNLSLLLLRITF